MTSVPIKILLVEDHTLTRHSLAFGLKKYPHLNIIADVDNGQEALLIAIQQHPDIILMDIMMPIMNGIEATQAIKQQCPTSKIIMLTSHSEQEKVFEAFAAGAEGYCNKDVKMDRLVQVIEMVKDGALWIDPQIAGLILKVLPALSPPTPTQPQKQSTGPDVVLSVREQEILALIAEGLNNKDIADRLVISLYTVKNHVSNIIQKLAVEDRTQAAVWALTSGLVKHDKKEN